LIQGQWVKYHDDIANATLIAKTDSWYGVECPGEAVQNAIVRRWRRNLSSEMGTSGYPGFAMS